MKSVRVAILGEANVGKSSLINSIIGEKISIVSSLPQTTQFLIRGVKTIKNDQIVFIDTPGINPSTKKDMLSLKKESLSSIREADLCIFMFGINRKIPPYISSIAKYVTIPKLAVINKIDKFSKGKLLDLTNELKDDFRDIMYTSALKKDGVDILVDKILSFAIEREWDFPEEQKTDLMFKERVTLLLQEQIFRQFYEEVPYKIRIEIDFMKKDNSGLVIKTSIFTRKNTIPIFLGKIKTISLSARMSMEETLKLPVHLYIKIKKI